MTRVIVLLSAAIGVILPLANGQAVSVVSQPRKLVQVYAVQDSPVKALSWSMGATDLLSHLKIKNYSEKEVRSLTFRWYIATPTECTADGLKKEPLSGLIGPIKADITSGGSIELKNLGIKPSFIASVASSERRLVVEIQLIPVEVAFADGSRWQHYLNPNVVYNLVAEKALSSNCKGNQLIPLQALACKPSRFAKLLDASVTVGSRETSAYNCEPDGSQNVEKCFETATDEGVACATIRCTRQDYELGQCGSACVQ